VLESFFQIFGMVGRYFSEFSAIFRMINECLTSLGTRVERELDSVAPNPFAHLQFFKKSDNIFYKG